MHVLFDLTILHMFPASSSLLYREHVIFAFTFFQTLIMIRSWLIHLMADQAIFAFSAPDPAALQELRRGPCCTTSSLQRTVPLCMWYCPTMPYHYRRDKNTASAPRKQPFRHCTVSKDLGCWWLLGISLKKKTAITAEHETRVCNRVRPERMVSQSTRMQPRISRITPQKWCLSQDSTNIPWVLGSKLFKVGIGKP